MTAEEVVEEELRSRGLAWSTTENGDYQVVLGPEGTRANISLANVRRDYKRFQDPEIIKGFLANFLNASEDPDWEEARHQVRFRLSLHDCEDLREKKVLYDHLGGDFVRLYVVSNPEGSRITWVTDHELQKWDVDTEEVRRQALVNMEELTARTKVIVSDADGVKFCRFETEFPAFLAAILISGDSFRNLVSEHVGYPVFAVVPRYDFAFAVSAEHPEFLPRFGDVVLEHYHKSRYRLTDRVLRISDDGVEEHGTFRKPEDSAADA